MRAKRRERGGFPFLVWATLRVHERKGRSLARPLHPDVATHGPWPDGIGALAFQQRTSCTRDVAARDGSAKCSEARRAPAHSKRLCFGRETCEIPAQRARDPRRTVDASAKRHARVYRQPLVMARIALIYSHPYPNRSRAGRTLLGSVSNLDEVKVRSLYERYPDFAIDVAAEQALLLEAELVVWQHPIYWYSPPPLMSLWFEKVLARGWAYGKGGDAVRGKSCLWVPTTGGDTNAYREGGMHGRAFEEYVAPVEQTARFCGMVWQPPLILHGSHHTTDEQLHQHGLEYRARLNGFLTRERAATPNGAGASA